MEILPHSVVFLFLCSESPAPQGPHVLASGLVTSLLLVIFILLIAYILR